MISLRKIIDGADKTENITTINIFTKEKVGGF